MVRQFYIGMMSPVTHKRTVSEAFAVTNGVKQSCVLTSTLFSLIFSATLTDVHGDGCPVISIVYKTDALSTNLLNSRRMQASTRLSTTTVHDLLFVDDCAPNTATEADIQRSLNSFDSG
nr:unnamed protein product [Spirometra erinaceieuropaei]